jgi:hypothetical protein
VLILENHGARVYADHDDPSLPGKDCVAIADHLREVIRECRKFVMLASPRSKDRKWIPWELGLGDGIRKPQNVALFPSAENATETEWLNQEYLALYPKITWGFINGQEIDGKPRWRWLVWNQRNNTGEPLEDWLQRDEPSRSHF